MDSLEMDVEGYHHSVHDNASRPPQPISVVIDAANVCWHFVKSQPGWVDVQSGPGIRPPVTGLSICIAFWKHYGLEPVAIIPSWWTRNKVQNFWGSPEWEMSDFQQMEDLRQGGFLFCSPAGEHDDVYLIDYTFRTDGFLVSNDKYRDHQQDRDLDHEFINERRIGFMFIKDTFLPNPEDLQRMELICQQLNKVIGPTKSLLPPPHTMNNNNVEASCIKSTSSLVPNVHEHVLQVPDYAIKFIIGRQGSKIKEISEESRATINIHRDESGPIRNITIRGTPESIHTAISTIDNVVQLAVRKHTDSSAIKMAAPDPVGFTMHDDL